MNHFVIHHEIICVLSVLFDMIVFLVVTAACIRAFESCLACQHFISDWPGKLKPNKLPTECQSELKGVAVEKATNPGRRLFFSNVYHFNMVEICQYF